jgi:hypothetical protein
LKKRLSIVLIALFMLLCATAASARNKVQYQKLEWRVQSAQKADIYYHRGEEEIAAQAVVIADEYTRKLQAWLHFSFYERVPIVVYAGHPLFSNTNITPYILPEGVAGFTEMIKGRVVLPYSGARASFRHVLAHELVHAAIKQKLQNLYARTNRMQGQRPPLWFEEGLAEYLSYGFPATDSAYIAELVVGGGLIPLDQINRISGSYRMYKEGQCLMAWLAEQRGEMIFGRLVESGMWESEFTKGMEDLLGYDMAELDRRWQADLRKRYMPAQAERSMAIDLARPLTRAGDFALGTVAYQRNGNNYLAYISTYQNDLRAVYSRLNEMGKLVDTRTLILFSTSVRAEDILMLGNRLGVSPDGSTLAIPVRSGPGYALLLMDSLTGKLRQRIRFPKFMGLTSPAFSPDGKQIVVAGTDSHGEPDLYLVELTGGRITQLNLDVRQESYPEFMADGKSIVFCGDDGNPLHGETCNLFILDITTQQLQQITSGRSLNGAALSPDRKSIAMSEDTPQGSNIYLWNIELGEGITVAKLAGPALVPAFSADGKSLLFSASHNGYFMLHELPIPGNIAPTPLAFEPRPAPELPKSPVARVEEKSKQYHPNYSLDILQSEVAFGPEVSTSLGAIVALTDTFSDRRISFILGSAAQSTQDFLSGLSAGAAYSDLSNRIGWEVGAFRFVESSSIWEERLYDEVRTGGELSFSYPFNSMQMVSLDLVSWFNERTYYNTYRGKEGSVITDTIKKDMTIGGAYVTLSNDTTLWQVDGPIDGSYAGLTVGGTRSLSQGSLLYLSLFPDWRTYLRLGKAEALAFRLVSWQTFGREALPFIFGGSLSMRGWDWLDFMGTRMAMGNAELRFNLADQVIADTIIGELGAFPLRGALFVDAGEAWGGELPDHFRTDAGFGFRWALGGVLVLRFDWAKRATIYYGGAASQKGSQVVDFKPGFPFQFFVGWSY